jgi:hypothetical protein
MEWRRRECQKGWVAARGRGRGRGRGRRGFIFSGR